MITVTQYFHYPNNTELGKGNTHECYLLVPNTYDLSHIFPDGKEVEVTDVSNKKKYYLRSAWGREFRINQMGQFYRDYDVHMGDEIILTHVKGEKSSTYISVNKHNRLVIKQGRNGAEIINLERLTSYKHGEIYEIPIVWAEQELTLQIQYEEAIAKRSDSPDLTDYYTVKLGNSILQNGSFFLTLGSKNELTTFEKTDMRVFPFDESIISNSTILKRKTITNPSEDNSSYLPYLTALRTKPFMLLAGISGTGKSRIVRELAFKSCPSYLQDEDGTTPGNYCMIEVKPNWHDSSELLGYYSNIAKQYVFTDFVKFLLKAKLYSDVPFFVCMDEMNLAPVEQYFAEFLSVLETRKQTESGIKTGALVKGHYFKRIKSVNEYDNVQTDADVYTLLEIPITAEQKEKLAKTNSLKTDGLTLPENVFVIGTVNMDDTTHQFSRKVLDRAMTIEMNGGELKEMFGHSSDLEYLPEEKVWKIDQFKPKHVNADEVLEAHPAEEDALKTQLADKLDAINQVLKDTPFVVSYRVLNELVIYAGVLLDDGKETEEAINDAVDQITLMKILPRIEGDEDLLGNAKDENNRLCQLMKVVGPQSQAKLREMNRRLESGFTRFWP